MWLWIASNVKTKLIPVMQVGGRSQEIAFSVVQALKGRLAASCVPVFSTDGLKHYFYALTAHVGKWETVEGRKPVWVLLTDFVYRQVIKHQRRGKTVEVERRVLVGEANTYAERLRQEGLSGRINTAFVERLNCYIACKQRSFPLIGSLTMTTPVRQKLIECLQLNRSCSRTAGDLCIIAGATISHRMAPAI